MNAIYLQFISEPFKLHKSSNNNACKVHLKCFILWTTKHRNGVFFLELLRTRNIPSQKKTPFLVSVFWISADLKWQPHEVNK